MKAVFAVCLLAAAIVALAVDAAQPSEAPTGFDNQSNGVVDQATHQKDAQHKFRKLSQADQEAILKFVGSL